MSENRFEDIKFPKVVFNSLSEAKRKELIKNGQIEEGEWYVTNDGFKDNAGGLDVLDIGQSLYIDETQGLRRWLNGQWVDINDNTRKFFEKLMKASTINPDLICSPTEYVTIMESNVFNQCGKFAYDVENGRVRLPKVVYTKEGLNISNIGNLSNQRILVAKKEPTDADPRGYNWYSDGWVEQYGRFGATGSDVNTTVYFPIQFKNTLFDVQVNMQYAGSATASWQYINARNVTVAKFETVCQSSTYHTWRACGYSDSLPAPSDINIPFDNTQYYYIQIATGLETVVNVTNDIQLNNPYSLGDSKYSPVMLNNVSWLAGGAQSTRVAYPSYYDFLYKIYTGEVTRGGITVKAVGDPTINRLDHVIDVQNETFTMPTLNGTEDVQSPNLNDRINCDALITSSGVELTAPYNGWYRCYVPYEADKYMDCYNENTDNHSIMSPASSGTMVYCDLWVWKGNIMKVIYSTTTKPYCYFRTATKPGYLYFYVGETVQNANLINAGKLTDIASTTMGDWTNPTTTSRTYCRRFADGWCEQGGYYYVGSTMANNNYKVVFPQPFKDTNFVFSFNHVYPGNGTADCGCENWTQRTPQSATVYNGTGGWQGFSWRASGYFK